MKAKQALKSKGSFSLKVKNDKGEVRQLGTTDNVVTYEGAYVSLLGGYMFSSLRARLGTGLSEIQRDSTDLGSPDSNTTSSASAGRSGNEIDNDDGTSTISLQREMYFGLGEMVGTFSEVGLYYSDTLVAGQLIKDELGDPTTITLLANEQLYITYTLEWTVPNAPELVGTGTVQDAESNSYAYEIWAQPYFTEYNINNSRTAVRFGKKSNPGFCSDTGAAIKYVNKSDTVSLSRTLGTVSFTRTTALLPPSSGEALNAAYYVPGKHPYGTPSYELVSTNPPLTGSHTFSRASEVIKFTPTISKTINDSFQLEYTIEYTI